MYFMGGWYQGGCDHLRFTNDQNHGVYDHLRRFTSAGGQGVCDHLRFTSGRGHGVCDHLRFTSDRLEGVRDHLRFTSTRDQGVCGYLRYLRVMVDCGVRGSAITCVLHVIMAKGSAIIRGSGCLRPPAFYK